MKAIGKLAAVAALCACGFGGYVFYQKNMAPHPAIVACEKAVKGVLVSPSSYVLDFAVMDVKNRAYEHPKVLLSFDAQNRMGANIRMEAMCEYGFLDVEKDYIDKASRQKDWKAYMYIDKSPFDTFSIVNATIDGREIDKLAVLSASADMLLEKNSKRKFMRSGPGKIIEVITSVNVRYEPDTVIYTPKDFIRYK